MEAWPLVEADFHATYGIDLTTTIGDRSWRWFRTRYLALPWDSLTKAAQRRRTDTTHSTITPDADPDTRDFFDDD